MGGGASKQAAKASEEAAKASLQRRRRLLFGSQETRPFESVPPRSQFRAEAQDEDLVFQRLGIDAQSLRLNLEAIHRDHDEGFLRPNALETLRLQLPEAAPISRRLYRVAQAQLGLVEPRRAQLTCYEVLALAGLLRSGSSAELLELLFCVFDADGDDRIGQADLEAGIDAFLQLASLPEADAKDFRRLDMRKRKAEVQRLAKLAMQDFAGDDSDPEPEAEFLEEPPAPPSPKDPTASSGLGEVCKQSSTASKVAETGQARKGGLCGKAPKDAPEDMAFQKAKPKAKGGLCGRKSTEAAAKEDELDREESKAKETEASPEDEAKAKAEEAAKAKAAKAKAAKDAKEAKAKEAKAKAKAGQSKSQSQSTRACLMWGCACAVPVLSSVEPMAPGQRGAAARAGISCPGSQVSCAATSSRSRSRSWSRSRSRRTCPSVPVASCVRGHPGGHSVRHVTATSGQLSEAGGRLASDLPLEPFRCKKTTRQRTLFCVIGK
ncbi:unnamed protein product [Effrenium voratum]|nr:unnamed protein product [Effrenium voratum]